MSTVYKERMKVFSRAALAIVLMGGAVAFAANYTWDGNGGNALWSNSANWTSTTSGVPDDSSDNAALTDVTPSATAIFDLGSATTLNQLVVAGQSFTKMTLHLQDAALMVANLNLGYYGQLDLDRNFAVTGVTTLSGHSSWIDVASGRTCDLQDVDVSYTLANLFATTTGNLAAHDITIDAVDGMEARGFGFIGGTMVVDGGITLTSDQASGTNDAKLLVTSGTVNITGGAGTGVLDMNGGDDPARQVELSVFDALNAETTEVQSGHVAIYLASGKTLYAGVYTLNGGANVTVTGSGSVKSGTAP